MTGWVVPAVCVLAVVVALASAIIAVRAGNRAARVERAMRDQLLFVSRVMPAPSGTPPWLKRMRQQLDEMPNVSIDVGKRAEEADDG